MEQWRTISRLPGYEISDDGKIRSLKGTKPKLLTEALSSSGYKFVCTFANGKRETSYIHRLVAEAFIPNSAGGFAIVNHKDKNKLNNSIGNLEWITITDNMFHWRETDRFTINQEIASKCEKMSLENLEKVLGFCKQINL